MGIIESFWNKGDNGRNRKYYRITKKGNGYLKRKEGRMVHISRSCRQYIVGGSIMGIEKR